MVFLYYYLILLVPRMLKNMFFKRGFLLNSIKFLIFAKTIIHKHNYEK